MVNAECNPRACALGDNSTPCNQHGLPNIDPPPYIPPSQAIQLMDGHPATRQYSLPHCPLLHLQPMTLTTVPNPPLRSNASIRGESNLVKECEEIRHFEMEMEEH